MYSLKNLSLNKFLKYFFEIFLDTPSRFKNFDLRSTLTYSLSLYFLLILVGILCILSIMYQWQKIFKNKAYREDFAQKRPCWYFGTISNTFKHFASFVHTSDATVKNVHSFQFSHYFSKAALKIHPRCILKGFFKNLCCFCGQLELQTPKLPPQWSGEPRSEKREPLLLCCCYRAAALLLKQQRRRHSLLHGAQWFIFKTNVKILFKDENGQIGLI